MKANYIKAVIAELKAGMDTEQVLTGLTRTLKTKGHTALYASILRGVVRILEAESLAGVTVTVANHRAYEAQKSVIEAALHELGTTESPTIVTDPTIIGGYVVETTNQRLNASYKAKLVDLYRSLTN